jgi:hypothetical protein
MATQIDDRDRLSELKRLSPLQAIQALLCDGRMPADEPCLVTAILRDRRIELDDDEVTYVIDDARRHGTDAATVYDRLLAAGDGFQACNLPGQDG